ncbi:MAG: hypothetical protein QOH05_4133, partial [Acetobacteraceae bacterium]|nr:hypothetical protein [Acetobacteraceae bacterium]
MPLLSYLACRTTLAATALAALAIGTALADDAVLISSTVPGYVPGMVVSSKDRLSVPDGASATLLFQSGGMLRLRGPFEGTLGDQQPRSGETGVAMLADMFRMHGVDATVIGATRSAGSARPAAAIDDVQIDPQRSGTYCVEPATSVWINRPANERDAYALRRKGSNRTLGWPSGAARVEWPSDVPIEDGSQFELVTNGTSRATVTFHEMPSSSVDATARVARGILLGCHDQFDDELRRVSRSVGGPELWLTSDRGRRPAYRPGEPISLTVTADVDGYLYCVAMRNDGEATPIFP